MEPHFRLIRYLTAARRRGLALSLLGLVLLLAAGLPARAQSFIHPGIWHKQSDLDRMKYMVQAGKDPWRGSFDLMRADPKSSYNYVVRGQNYTAISREPVCDHCNDFESDARAAYLNSLMWYLTGDQRHAAKAIQCLNAWNSLTRFYGGGTEPLSAGLYASLIVNAAEILKNTNSGWAPADIARFQAMLVYPGYSATTAPTAAIASKDVTFYWSCYQGDPARHGNQDILPMKAVMEMGIFLDNRVMFDRGLRYLKGLPHRADDLPYASGPGITGALSSKTSYMRSYSATRGTSVPDYGFNGVITNYIWPNGQCQESSRDQGHTMLGVNAGTEAAEIAWNQGDNLYGIGNRRLLLGNEYSNRYNVSYRNTFADQPTPWEPTVASGEFVQRFDRTGRFYSLRVNPFTESDSTIILRGQYEQHPGWEMALAHFQGRLGIIADSTKWTQRALERSIAEVGYEQSGNRTDNPGWGGLTFRRPALSPGDPVAFSGGQPQYRMNVLPGTVEAENFDYFITGGQGKTYNDLSPTNTGGQYRPADGVDLATCSDAGGGYHVTDLQPGEWLNYTVAVPVDGNYRLAIRYASASAGGSIRIELDGVDKTGDVAVPFGGSSSTGPADWQDFTVAASVPLQAGVQSLRIFVMGAGGAFNLNNFSVSLLAPTTPPAAPNDLSARGGYSQVSLTWDAAVSATSYSVKRALASGGPYTLLASGLTATSYTDLGLTNGTTYYYVVSASNAIGEGANSAEDSATPDVTNALVEDAFETNSGPVTGRTPELASVAGRVYQSSPQTTTYTHIVVGGVARLTGNLGEAVDLRSYPGYSKPTYLNITATFDVGTLANNVPARPARGFYLGFWSALIASGNESGTNMRGIFVNPENGQLQLWNGSATPTSAPLQTLPYQGTWVGSTQPHTLSYTVNTTTGNISECVLDGATYQWNRITIFSDANTAYAGFGVAAGVAGQYANVQYFRVKDNLVANEVVRTPQTITFPELADQNLGNADFAPGATATSGLPITYTSSNPAVATITSGGLIRLVAAGMVTITATQPGDGTFEAAAAVSQTLFVLNPAGLGPGLLLADEFTTPSATVVGRTPEVATVLGRAFQKAPTNTTNATSVSGGFARLTANIGVAVDIRSGTGYTKPTEMNLALTFNGGTLGNNTPARPARGGYLGFWSSLPTSGNEPGANMRGIFVNPENGQLQLWNGSATPTVAASQSLAYQGTWVGGTQPHILSYTVNTVTGNISNCVLDGVGYPWAATTIFTDANTAFAGFGCTGSATSQFGNFDRFNLTSKSEQIVTFNPLPTKQVGDADFAPGATSSSNLAPTYTSSNQAVATITSGGLIHVMGAGTTTITAAQAGDANYLAASSRTRTLTVVNQAVWNGSVDTNWATAANWAPAAVPTATDNVLIPGSPTNQPTVSTAQAVNHMVLGSGATLTTAAGGQLTVGGNLTNNGGTLAGSADGTVVLAGTAMQTIGGGSPVVFQNLTVGTATAMLTGAASVRRMLVLNGNLHTAGQTLTLLSDAQGTALVVNNGTNGVVGTATVQRYIDPSTNAGSGYRHYSSPVQATTVADLTTSGFTPVVNPAYNTQGNAANSFPTVYGYDEQRVSATATGFDQGWYSPDALTSALTPGRAYTVNIPATQTVDFVGTLNNGPLSLATLTRGGQGEAGWHLLGNPYPSPVDWDAISRSGVDGAVYVYHSSGPYAGTYSSYANGIGTNGGTNQLAAMQGFFVRASAADAAGSLRFTNAARLTTYANPVFNRSAPANPLVRLSLRSATGGADEAVVYFAAEATEGLDAALDAHKLPVGGTVLLASQLEANQALSINALPILGAADVVVNLRVQASQPGTYTLRATELLNLPAGTTAYLRDAQTGTHMALSPTTSYSFTLAAGAAATGRFSLLLSAQQVLSTASAQLSQQVTLFPNPARHQVTLGLPADVAKSAGQVTLLNALGQVVARYALPAASTTLALPLSGIAQGIYTLRLETDLGLITKRLTVE
jgi:hypothetical protein